MPPTFKDYFSDHASDYRTFRPDYPAALFSFLTTLVPRESRVWDCGTGNGQAAVALAAHFARVFATDASAEQIRQAEAHPRVEYAVAAERCPLPDRAVGLVTAAQALHWFDLNGFFAEVKRVCKPEGCLAVWTYNLHSVDDRVDPVLNRFENDFVGPYWPPERALVEAGYRTIPFPFQEVPAPHLEMSAHWDLRRMLGYMSTWSSTKAFIKDRGFNPVEHLAGDLASAWGDPNAEHTVRWEFCIRVGKVV